MELLRNNFHHEKENYLACIEIVNRRYITKLIVNNPSNYLHVILMLQN